MLGKQRYSKCSIHVQKAVTLIQSDRLLHRYMLPVFFATDQLHHPPCCAKILQLVRIVDWYSIRVKKRKR